MLVLDNGPPNLWRNAAIVLSSLAVGCALAGALLSDFSAPGAVAIADTLLVGPHLRLLARLFYLPVLQHAGL